MPAFRVTVDGPGLENWPAQELMAFAESEEAAVDDALSRAVDDHIDLFGAETRDDLTVVDTEMVSKETAR